MLTEQDTGAMVASMPRVAIITNMPVSHQSHLFGELARQPECDIHVFFLRQMTPGRQWARLPPNDYPHTFIKEHRIHPHFYLNSGLLKSLRGFQPELIVICQYASIAMQGIMYYASAAGIPWVFWSERPGVEWTELPIFESDRLRQIFRWIALAPVRTQWPREVWAVGSRAVEHYQEICKTPCRNLPYYSDLTEFFAINRKSVGAPVRLLYSGKFNTRNGVDLLTSACDRLLGERDDFTISFMGDGPLKSAVDSLVAQHGDRVSNLGFRELDEIADVLASHDAFICSSRYDGWGMVVAESMAAGLPVVGTTSTGSARDLIEHGKNGYLVHGNSADALYGGIGELLDNGAELSRMGRSARQTARRFHHVPGACQFAELIHGVVGKGAA